MLLKLLVPTIVTAGWNDETLGDIVEGLLANGMRPYAYKPAETVALWLGRSAGLVFTVRCWVPQVLNTEHLIALMDAAERSTYRRSDDPTFRLDRMDQSVA